MAVKNIQDVAPYAANFSLVVVFLAVMLRKPLRKFLYQRHERTKDAVESAAIAFDKAQAKAEQARAQLAKVAAEEAGLLQRERSQAEVERAEILAKAASEARRVSAESARLAQVEQEEASDRVKDQFLELIVAEAEERLKRGLKKDDHSAILKRAQSSIEVGV
jgi:F-type H+-transporting ATPase subunit b